LRHREDQSRRAQWHVLAVDHDTYISPSMQMPHTLRVGESFTFKLSMYPRGKQPEGILRVRVEPPEDYTTGPVPAWAAAVELNEMPLEPTCFVAAPLHDPYEANLVVDPTRFSCFKVDRGAVLEGTNFIRVKLLQPAPGGASKVVLDYLDVAWPGQS